MRTQGADMWEISSVAKFVPSFVLVDLFTCLNQVSTARQPYFYLFDSRRLTYCATPFLLVCFKAAYVLRYPIFTCLLQGGLRIAHIAFIWPGLYGLEALFVTKRSRTHETFLQTCFVGVRCGCRSTCLHEMQPRHNLLRHNTNNV